MKDMKALQNGSDIRGIALPVEGYEVNLTTDMVKKIGWEIGRASCRERVSVLV